MEKKYITPEMEITEFEAEDVITTSTMGMPTDSETPGQDGGSGWGDWN